MCKGCIYNLFGFFLQAINLVFLLFGLAIAGYGIAEALDLLYFGSAAALVACVGLYASSGNRPTWVVVYALLCGGLCAALATVMMFLEFDSEGVRQHLDPKLAEWTQEKFSDCVAVLALSSGAYLVQTFLAFFFRRDLPILAEDYSLLLKGSEDSAIKSLGEQNAFVSKAREESVEVQKIRDRLKNKYQGV